MGSRSKGCHRVHRYCLGEARVGKTKPRLPIGYMRVRGACHKFFFHCLEKFLRVRRRRKASMCLPFSLSSFQPLRRANIPTSFCPTPLSSAPDAWPYPATVSCIFLTSSNGYLQNNGFYRIRKVPTSNKIIDTMNLPCDTGRFVDCYGTDNL